MAALFEDSEFTAACEELDEPKLEEWEFFTESHGMKIYRSYNASSGLYKYKVFGEMDLDPEICSQVYMDLEYRKTWDNYVHELYEKEADNKKLIYWGVKFPKPMSYRDYVYKRELRIIDWKGAKVYVIIAQSVDDSISFPEKWMTVRVDDYYQSLVISKQPEGGTKVFMQYYDDPKGMIPTWLINWAAKTAVPAFLTQMSTACKNYPKYLKSKADKN
ncbi:phosphatidylcholine transfer protein-like [Octopus vulgaris]|uniref:Phosphatidylcholine transfer protein-like n=2 Tax=Octopus TaxID=6643 RepID=A0AA36AT99_OCTVU|nr:phosphatidylcholine transfer protein [Octopus sinensis]CAI9721289.1 phosphatidylcholine transfer protein-like [Octopus vulgaris]